MTQCTLSNRGFIDYTNRVQSVTSRAEKCSSLKGRRQMIRKNIQSYQPMEEGIAKSSKYMHNSYLTHFNFRVRLPAHYWETHYLETYLWYIKTESKLLTLPSKL